MNLNERLKEIRIQHKKTQQQVADHLGIERASYTQYESGRRSPSVDTLSKLADYFNCSTDYLLGRSDHPAYEIRTDLPEQLTAIAIDALQILMDAELTPEEIQALVEFAQKIKKQNKDTTD